MLSPNTAPLTAQPGVTVVNLTGNNFPDGTILPGEVNVALQVASGSTGPALTTTVNTVTTIAGSTRRIAFQVNGPNVLSPTPYLVSVSGTTSAGTVFLSANQASLTINPPPIISSLLPNTGLAGQSVTVNITGQFTTWVQGATQASFGPGISVGGGPVGGFGPIIVVSSTTGSAQLTIDPSAVAGARAVTVATGVQQATLVGSFTVQTGTSPGCTTPSGLVSWWPLDGSGVDIVDGNSGGVQGGQFDPAKVGSGFNSSNGIVLVTNTPNLNVSQFTIETWLKADNISPTNMVIVWKGRGGQNITTSYALQVSTKPDVTPQGKVFGTAGPGKISMMLTNGVSDQIYYSNSALPLGTFHHIATTVDGLRVRIYVDGQLDADYLQMVTPFASSNPFQIGGIQNSTEDHFQGVIDELSLYNRALTSAEIQAIFAAGSVGKCKGQAGNPVISSITPNFGKQGQQNLSIVITGHNTHFVQGTTQANFGAGITVASLAVSSATSAVAIVNIDSAAAVGLRTVSVNTGAEAISLIGGFTISSASNQAPTVSAGPNQTITIPFDSFEGDLSAWIVTGPGTATITNSVAHTGSKSVQLATSSTFPWSVYLAHDFGSQQTGAVSVYLHSQTNSNASADLAIFQDNGGWVNIQQLGNGDFNTRVCATPSSPASICTTGVSVKASNLFWHQLEIDTTANGVTVKLDGNTILTNPSITRFRVANLDVWGAPSAGSAFFDDFSVSTGTTLNGSVIDDGFPANAALNAIWNLVSGPDTVSFGTPTTTFPNVAKQLNPVTTTATFHAPGIYVISLTGSDSQLSNGSNVTITVDPALGGSSTPILSVNPNAAQQGQTLAIAITGQGTHFTNASTIDLGPGITVSNISAADATHLSAQITVGTNAPVGTRQVTITTGAETVTFPSGFTVTPPSTNPIITTVSPTTGQQGQSGPIAIVGFNTHFVQGTSVFDLGAGITVSNVSVSCATCLSAQVAIADTAALGPRNVTVTTGSEVASLTNGFSVQPGTPVVTSFGPTSGRQGQTLTVTVTAKFTHFVQGTTAVNLGAGISVTSVVVANATSLTAQVSIDAAAALGARTLTVTTGTETARVTDVFTVEPLLAPITVAPISGRQGQSLALSITGQLTHFSQGSTAVSVGADITVGPVTVTGPTTLTAQITIPDNAATGPRTITVTTGPEVVSAPNAFTVSLGTIILSLSPGAAYQNQTVSVAITGQLTNFVQGTTQASFGAGISVGGGAEGGFGPVTVSGPTTATARIVVNGAAGPGARTVRTQTGTETAFFTNGFTVLAPFVISSIAPNSAQAGQQNVTVAVVGQNTHFAQGSSVLDLGPGVTIASLTVADATRLSAIINVGATATMAVRDVAVTTGSEFALLKAGFTVIGPSSLSSITPNSGPQGQLNLPVTIVGQNTHFANSSAIGLGTGITVSNISATDATHLSAQLNIGASATTGVRTLTVTTGTEVVSLANAFTVTTPGNQAPVITIAPTWSLALPARLTLTYTVTDDGLPSGGALTVSWDTVSGQGTVGFTNQTPTSISAGFSQAGSYVLRITATDTQLTTTSTVTVTVTGTPLPPPTVSIATPADGAEITTTTNVTGTVDSPALVSWTLEYRPSGSSSFQPFASGTTPVSNGVLGPFDPTTLLNGTYDIRLSATDTSGQTSTAGPISVALTKNQKVGNFTVSFTDMSIPMPGLTIQVVRTYDSRRKALGDFGYGWTLDLRNVSLAENRPAGGDWINTTSGGAFPTYCIQPAKPHVVTVTLPDGSASVFDVSLTPQCQQLVPPSQVTIGFTPRPGTTASLAILGNAVVLDQDAFPGQATLFDLNTGLPFDASRYRLTFPDGRALDINQTIGLEKITDTNGNTLTVTPGGIIHSAGKSILFQRDALSRITQITDPAGTAIAYSYDLNGNLASVKDQENNTTTFTYSNHYLQTILDPRGIQPIRNEYDNAGRLISHTDAFGKTITYTHNLSARQEIVTDRLGNVTLNEYDADGNVTRVTDALGGITTRTYDSRDNMLSETNALSKTRSYTYDGQDNRLTEKDPLGSTTTYTYNSRKQVLTITDPLGRVTTNIYDGNGNLTSTKDPSNNITSYTYNAQGLRTFVTDPLGGITGYQYDAAGNITQQTDALGHITTYTYDANGNKLTETRSRSTTLGTETLLTSYQYDRLNRLVKTTYPDGSTTQVAYNAIGKQSITTDQLGRQTSYVYDDMGRLAQTNFPDATNEQSHYDAEGHRISSIDRANRTTTYLYDKLGRLTKTTYPDDAFTSTIYDAIGQVISSTDARGDVTGYEYDDAGRRTRVTDPLNHITNFQYDAVGNQTFVTDANNTTTQYQYDNLNRRIKVIFPDTTSEITTYDPLGRVKSKTDQANVMTQFAYDSLGRLTQVTDALSQLTKYTYDELGSRLSQTDANNHTTSSQYDKLGRRTRHTLPLGMFESLTYDAAGNLKTRTDFNGKITTYAYDPANRLTSKTPDPSFAAPPVQFTYTNAGQRQSMTDASGTTSYIYDPRDRLTQKTTSAGSLTYNYDLGGNLTSVRSSNANGASVNYSYDQLNRLSTVQDNRLAAGTSAYGYDRVGNLQGYTDPNGVQTTYTYNQLNRLTKILLAKGAMLASYSYQLGPAGNRTQVAELGGRQVDYAYDALYRLKSETIAGASASGTIGYQYDAVGNRLQRTSSVAPVPAAASAYDADDRLGTDTYDANGNTIGSGGNTYTYDFENHLKTQNAGAVSVLYDGDGNRVAKTIGGVTTQYLVDDHNLTGYAQVLEEISGGAVQRVYTYGLNRISQSQASGTSFYGYDGHGSVRLLTDATGAVTDRYDYDAFGNIISQAGATPNVYLYSGEQNDPNLGFYYLRARYLAASSGRFISMDSHEGSLLSPASLHRYVYGNGDPVNRIDPSGLVSLTDVVGSAIGAAFSTFFADVKFVLPSLLSPRNDQFDPNVTTPLGNGAGFISYEPADHQYGRQATVEAIRRVGQVWHFRTISSGTPRPNIQIGDMSLRGGGAPPSNPPHKGHQHGFEVDIRPMRSDFQEGMVSISDSAYSRSLTEELINIFYEQGATYILFDDPNIFNVIVFGGHTTHFHVSFNPDISERIASLWVGSDGR
jgi:RHS repeat-associated protein